MLLSRRLICTLASCAVALFVAAGCGDGDSNEQSALPGTRVPDQKIGHFNELAANHTPTPFCQGVPHAGADGVTVSDGPTPAGEPTRNCHLSNPPSSGRHQAQKDGEVLPIRIPPDLGIYPDDAVIPRDAIAHILEHAGVFVGYHCADGDAACAAAVERVAQLVDDRLTNEGERVVMAPDRDLPQGEIGLAAWNYVDRFPYAELDDQRVVGFIAAHSCRYDPEGACR